MSGPVDLHQLDPEVRRSVLRLRDAQNAGSANLTAHLDDTADAHDASAISVVDSGGYFAGTDVESVLQEVGANIDPASSAWTSFSPSWSGVTVGNGSDVAVYRYTPGKLEIHGRLQFGSTTAVTGAVTMTLPDSASIESSARYASIIFGELGLLATGNTVRHGAVFYNTSTSVRFRAWNVAGTYASRVDLSSTVPHTWAVNDALGFRFSVPV